MNILLNYAGSREKMKNPPDTQKDLVSLTHHPYLYKQINIIWLYSILYSDHD